MISMTELRATPSITLVLAFGGNSSELDSRIQLQFSLPNLEFGSVGPVAQSVRAVDS